MLSRLRVRQQSQYVIPLHRSRVGTWLLMCAAITVLLGLLVYTSLVDERSDASVRRAAALERERAAKVEPMLQAYERGMSDALATVQGHPNGIALAQACAALRRGQ